MTRRKARVEHVDVAEGEAERREECSLAVRKTRCSFDQGKVM